MPCNDTGGHGGLSSPSVSHKLAQSQQHKYVVSCRVPYTKPFWRPFNIPFCWLIFPKGDVWSMKEIWENLSYLGIIWRNSFASQQAELADRFLISSISMKHTIIAETNIAFTQRGRCLRFLKINVLQAIIQTNGQIFSSTKSLEKIHALHVKATPPRLSCRPSGDLARSFCCFSVWSLEVWESGGGGVKKDTRTKQIHKKHSEVMFFRWNVQKWKREMVSKMRLKDPRVEIPQHSERLPKELSVRLEVALSNRWASRGIPFWGNQTSPKLARIRFKRFSQTASLSTVLNSPF